MEKKNPEGLFPPASGCLMFGVEGKNFKLYLTIYTSFQGLMFSSTQGSFYDQEKRHQSSSKSNRNLHVPKKTTILSWSWG